MFLINYLGIYWVELYYVQYFQTTDTVSPGARCSSVVRAFVHGAMGRRIDPSWGGPIELFLIPASAPQLV